MEKKTPKIELLFMLLIAVFAWTGVVLQYYIVTGTWQGLGLSSAEGTVRFFAYFTILTNILVAFSLTSVLLKPKSISGVFFNSNGMQTAIAVYIFVVGLVYNLILRSLWKPEGLQLIVDNILHSMVPLLYIIYWMVFIPKEKLATMNSVKWLAYPAIYFIWVLILGYLTKFYPYPFIDVNELGYPKMFLHAGILLVVFYILNLIAINFKKTRTN